jgi:hypothetical protein
LGLQEYQKGILPKRNGTERNAEIPWNGGGPELQEPKKECTTEFCVQETEYLGYILTRGGIKPQQKKVQAILTLNQPNNVKELRRFLGMVQYYRDMWQRRSEMLAPLTDLVGECGETKTTKRNKTKKKP